MKPHCQRTLLVTLLLVGACTRPDERMVASAEPPPAAAIAPIEAGTPLDELLALLEAELAAAVAGGEGEEAATRLTRAEAISDRLLEATLPFAWLSGESYSLPARLRQIQSGADRIMALIRGGAQPDRIRDQSEALRADVAGLRAALAEGGGPAPPTLDMLLAGRDTTDLYAPDAASN